MSVLFVHANSDDRAMYAEYLRGEGFAVEEVGEIDDALPLVGSAEAVITGLMVPGTIDPVDFIQKVRSESSTLPIIVVTACVMDDRMERAYRAGASVVLTKPCLPDALLDAVQTTMEAGNIRLVPRQPRRASAERRSNSRGGRRAGDQT